MAQHPLAGTAAPADLLANVSAVLTRYEAPPDIDDPSQRVAFGTSGHRGSSLRGSFQRAHIQAITQAVVEYRAQQGITGPLYLGRDSHALSLPAQDTALAVLAANNVTTLVGTPDALTPTPAVSHAIIRHNRDASRARADGLILTPSHNPPEDGGIKYNPPHGGPADTDATRWIEDRANQLLRDHNRDVRLVPESTARNASCIHTFDFVSPYVNALHEAINLEAIANARIRMGVDPLGGSNIAYWAPIAERYKLDITVVNPAIDPQFSFVPLDHDGKIRTDCSSPFAMAGLIALRDRFDIAFGNDADSDRHGIVTRSAGLMNPNHYLAVAIQYLCRTRTDWSHDVRIGKTLVSSAMIDRVVASLNRVLWEVPVGFKWFVPGLSDGTMAFGGEESAGASFLARDASTWSTDKDGILLDLLSAEILAVTQKDPAEHYRALTSEFGEPFYKRVDQVASSAQKKILKALRPEQVQATTLAGDPITSRLTRAPGNQADIGGLKVTSTHGWFAARPSGTEDVYKIYAESFRGEAHLNTLLEEASQIVDAAFRAGGSSTP